MPKTPKNGPDFVQHLKHPEGDPPPEKCVFRKITLMYQKTPIPAQNTKNLPDLFSTLSIRKVVPHPNKYFSPKCIIVIHIYIYIYIYHI